MNGHDSRRASRRNELLCKKIDAHLDECDQKITKRRGKPVMTFQAITMKGNARTGDIKVRGRDAEGRSVGLTVKGYNHFFYLSRQRQFENSEQAADILAFIEDSLRWIGSSNSKAFRSPDYDYTSRNANSESTYLGKDFLSGKNDAESLYHAWSLIEGKYRTMYGKTPDDYRENVVRVYAQKPKYARIIHKFLESSNFRDGYCRRYGITKDAFSKGHMLRTFEATFVDMDLAFKVKYGLRMMTWWSVYNVDFSIKDRAFDHSQSTIYCDVYAECGCEDIDCDESRTDNANFLRMGWDIECAGKMKEDDSEDSRFPIPIWDNYQYITYAKEVMNLSPPRDKVVLRPFSDRWVKDRNERDDAFQQEYATELDALKEALEAREESLYGEEDTENGGKKKAKTDGMEKFKISREDWNAKVKGWTSDDWTAWLSQEIPAQLGEESLRKVLDMTGKASLEELIPDPTDTDPVTVICIALKRNDDENSDRSGFVFADAVAFVYEHPGADKLETIDGEKIDRAGNVWKFGNIRFRTYSSEARMIHEFLEYRRYAGPDIEETWNGLVFFDIPYLWSRLHHLQIYGSEEDKEYASDINFGYEKGKNVKSIYFERSTSTNAGGDRMERIVSTDLVVHNDGYLIITNSSFGEKNISNTLDVISMKKLIYPRSCTSAIVSEMIANDDLSEPLIDKLYKIKFKKDPDPLKDTLESKAMEIFNDFPMRKMQFKVSEGTKRWLKGGNALREYAEYCFVDSVLPVFIGGKLPLQVAVARETNLSLNDIFYTGVQKKVFSVLYQITKTNPEFAGKFLAPDKGTLWLHWPGVFDDFEKGFERAVSEDPRLKSPFIRSSVVASDVLNASDSSLVRKKSPFDDLDAYSDKSRTAAGAKKKPTVKERKITGKDAKNSTFVKKSQTSMAAFLQGADKTATKRKIPETPVKPNSRPTKKQKTKSKIGTSQKKYEGALVLEPIIRGFITEKVPVKRPQIALGKAIDTAIASNADHDAIKKAITVTLLCGIEPKGSCIDAGEDEIEVPSLVSTGDYEGLYPSILEAYTLCYMTFLTSKTIERDGYERWQYTQHVLGTEDRISCGELLIDEKRGKEKGYRTDRLKVSHFYNEPDPKKTIYGTMVGTLKRLRREAKRKKAEADEVVKALDTAISDEKEGKLHLSVLSEKLKKLCGGRFEKMLSQSNAVPIALIKRMAKQESSVYDSTQNALKIINNSTYGAPAVEEIKAKLPMMEIGATVTAAGRTALTLAKTISLRTTAQTMKKFTIGDITKVAPKATIDCGVLQRRLPYGWVRRNVDRLSSRFKNDVITGDSVIGNTALAVKFGGLDRPVETVRMDELHNLGKYAWEDYPNHEGKEFYEPDHLYVWSDKGFTRVKKVIRHLYDGEIIRVLTHTGVVDCTRDHSLLKSDGKEVSPTDVNVGDALLHVHANPLHTIDDNLSALEIANLGTVSKNEAYLMGAFLADGSCGVYDCPSGIKASWAINKKDLNFLEKLKKKSPYGTKILDTVRSSAVYKLVLYGENTKQIATRYRSLFYNDHREKKVPSLILNAKESIVKAFMKGFYAGDGSKKERTARGYHRFDQKGKEVSAGLWFLAKKLGYDCSLNDRKTKPEVFRITGSGNFNVRKPTDVIKKKWILRDANVGSVFVYDLETENHHFHVGPGDTVVHNTDSVMVQLAANVYGKHEHFPKVPGGRNVIDEASKASWFLIRLINAYMFGEMNLVFEKMAEVMLANDKKFYKMLLCIFNNRPSDDILEKGGTIKRDTALFVQKIVAETNAFVFKAVGGGEPIKEVMARVLKLVEDRMEELLYDKVHLRDLTSNKGLKKLNYKNMQEHVGVAEKMRNRGKQFSVGDTIRYSFVHVPFSDQELDAYRAYKKNFASNVDAKFPVRKRKGVELAEDVSEISEKNLALDLHYIFEHKLVNPLVGHFRHMLFPLSREEYPHVDEYTMSPEEIEDAQAVRKKTKARQTLQTRNLLFSKFESKLKDRMKAAYENALDDRNRARLIKNMPGWTNETNKRTFYECAFCKKIKRTGDECIISAESLVPKRACSECLASKGHFAQSALSDIERLRVEYDVQKQLCTGCAYFLDNRLLNTDACTSTQCAVYQKKEDVRKKITASERNLLFLKDGTGTDTLVDVSPLMAHRKHILIEYEDDVGVDDGDEVM